MNRVLVRQGVQQRAILTPQPHRFVIAAGDNGVAIRAHIDREYAPFMAGEAIKLIATKTPPGSAPDPPVSEVPHRG